VEEWAHGGRRREARVERSLTHDRTHVRGTPNKLVRYQTIFIS
jgi:hypothetical protein